MSSLHVKNIYVLAFLVLLGLLVYAPILDTTFFSDDFTVLYRLTKVNFNTGSFFRPLSDASIYLDYIFYGTRADGFHVSNVLIHAATAFLCYLAAVEFFKLTAPGSASHKFYASICAVLFLVYPFHSEAVVWVVGRGVLLAASFSILSLYIYLKAKGNGYFLLAAFCYFISLFGYESPVLLPVIILIIELLCKRWSRSSIRALLPFAVAALAYLFVRFMQLGDIAGNHQYFSLSSSLRQLLLNVFRLIERSMLPPMQNSLLAIVTIGAVVTSGLLMYCSKQRPAVMHKRMLSYVLMYAVSLLPVITVGIDTHDTEGERFLYFPSFFFVLMTVQLLYVWFEKSNKSRIPAAIIFVYCLFFLEISLSNWVKASGIIRSITAHPERYYTKGILYVIDLPDNYRGAFIFRNGFEQAFRLQNQPLHVKKVVVLSSLHINHPQQEESGYSGTPTYDGKRFVIKRLSRDSILIKDNLTNNEHESGPEDNIFFFKNEDLHLLK